MIFGQFFIVSWLSIFHATVTYSTAERSQYACALACGFNFQRLYEYVSCIHCI